MTEDEFSNIILKINRQNSIEKFTDENGKINVDGMINSSYKSFCEFFGSEKKEGEEDFITQAREGYDLLFYCDSRKESNVRDMEKEIRLKKSIDDSIKAKKMLEPFL